MYVQQLGNVNTKQKLDYITKDYKMILWINKHTEKFINLFSIDKF